MHRGRRNIYLKFACLGGRYNFYTICIHAYGLNIRNKDMFIFEIMAVKVGLVVNICDNTITIGISHLCGFCASHNSFQIFGAALFTYVIRLHAWLTFLVVPASCTRRTVAVHTTFLTNKLRRFRDSVGL